TNAQQQTDPLDRPFKVVNAVGTSAQSQSSFSYNDAARIVTVKTDKATYNDNALKVETLYDKLGRTIETHTYESATAFIISKQEYDALGRVKRTYNPYRTTSDPTYGWAETTYDALGRITSVKTNDNAQVSNVYNNNSVTITDQANRSKRTLADSLGRITQVIEDPAGANYQTNYSYDVLGKLRKVQQDTQSRYFMYDSLSRLIRARNPEQEVNTSLTPALSDPVTNQNAWTAAYTYDANDNLETKTDARTFTTTYAYDVLNRNTSVTYSANANTPNIINSYDNTAVAYGKGRLWRTETTGDAGALVSINSFDAAGRSLSLSQQFKTGGVWSAPYTTQRSYYASGSTNAETYPSGHTVSYLYDDAGRLKTFSGNLSDGVSRNYSSELKYDAGGRMIEEQFGTQTILYNKLQYNIRGQLYDVRLSTLSRAQSLTDWDRGCLAFYYSLNNQAWGASASDNNGNLIKAETYVPNADGSSNLTQDRYTYDALNRLQQVDEYQYGAQFVFMQKYDYDRWGNRTINPSSSLIVNRLPFDVNSASNRLGVPVNQSGEMLYDKAGNLTKDTYSRTDTRTYDAENRLVTNAAASNQLSRYTYEASGKRVRRNIYGQETWQVYGIGGELLAEYAANAPATSVQTEYGYRGKEILVSATPTSLKWLVNDQTGTTRMVVDKSGSLNSIERHDFLPFGEEVFGGTGGRTPQQGYGLDSVRQKFVQKERDVETGLDYFGARYYSSSAGRFTSVDPLQITSDRIVDPQQLNLYAYARNNPIAFVDAGGLEVLSIKLVIEGKNQVPAPTQELGKVIDLGPAVKGIYFAIAVNIVVEVSADDSPDNYEPDQQRYIISPVGKNSDPYRPGTSGIEESDDPESSLVITSGSKLIWLDNPGIYGELGKPAAEVGADKDHPAIGIIALKSTVKPKKGSAGTPTDKVLYWAVRIEVVKGVIVKGIPFPITEEEYNKVTKQSPPKKKKKKEPKSPETPPPATKKPTS
ncbi:MAG TPA: RHS repeat-associated core domain-containing protein, partial [Pyrinomonadaceae bacterium]